MPVINKYHHGNKVPKGAINIMRGTEFGNPFPITDEWPRERALDRYRRYLWMRIQCNPQFSASIAALHRKTLCCCCKPKPCHGDILLSAAAYLQTKAGRKHLKPFKRKR